MIEETLEEISRNFKELSSKQSNLIKKAADLMINSIASGGKVVFCGNGGSAADSQHLAAELVGRYKINRDPLAAIALTTDTSTLTAIGNDFSFDEIFSRQIKGLCKNNDILYAISTSGKSQNIILAIEEAKKIGMKIIGLTGDTGNNMEKNCDILINVPANRPDRIQEMHIAIGQIICEIIENKFFNQ
jgi:D-sedoheptulose 7-phosphate isomerase